MSAVKVTLTLPDDLLRVVDQFVAEHEGATRSGVCAKALRGWLQAHQESEIAAYYQSLTEEERSEDHAWAATAAVGANRRWE